MASIQASRFALLNVDDDDESDTNINKKSINKQQSQNASKKKNKKKKKALQSAETDELRNLAFNKGTVNNKPNRATGHSRSKGDAGPDQWEQWKKVDEEFTVDHFERDLQAALIASKVQHEETEQVKQELKAQGIELNDDGTNKKKKKKEKKGKMSLDEFQKLDKSKLPKVKKSEDDSSEEETISIPSPPTAQVSNPDPKFFDNVDSDVQKVLQKEKIQEQYKKSYAMESVRTQQFEVVIEEKDNEIEELKETNKLTQAELKQVKKRNQQLCHILSQGEMKDKTKILMELEELRSVRDELTAEVTSVTAELEKERSKVHQLQGEQSKAKGGKHGK